MPYEFEILNEIKSDVDLIWDLEKKIHKLLRQFKITPSKNFHGATECFYKISHNVKDMIRSIEASKKLP